MSALHNGDDAGRENQGAGRDEPDQELLGQTAAFGELLGGGGDRRHNCLPGLPLLLSINLLARNGFE